MSEHTPGPWKWGDGWGSNEKEKYMDFQLFGAKGEEIIPIRVDHYETIWDVDLFRSYLGGGITSKADRDLIEAAPDLLEALGDILNEYIHEREVLWSSVTLFDGSIPDPEDAVSLASMDQKIAKAESAIAKACAERE